MRSAFPGSRSAGGHLGQLSDVLRPSLEKQLAARVLSARWRRPTIEAADIGAAPGATGAAMRALDDVIAFPARWLD